MKLDEKQRDKLVKFLQEKWKPPASCTVCRSNTWDVSKEIYELREFQGGGLVVGPGPIVPVVPVTCTTCGNTVLLNALVAGIELKGEPQKNE